MVRTLAGSERDVKRRRQSKAAGMRKKSAKYNKPEPTEIYPKLDVRTIYLRNCVALGIKPNTRMLEELPEGPGSDDRLADLDVASNYLGDRGSHAVIECIRLSTRLMRINFANNGLTDDTVDMLVTVLGDHPSVQAVDLSNNLISQDSIPAVKRVLRANPRIIHFNLSKNANIYDASLKDIETILALNAERRISGTTRANLRGVLQRLAAPPPHHALSRKLGLEEYLNGRRPRRIPPRNADGWACVSVFVNATFSDFHTELHVINHRIVPELNHRLRPYKIYILPIDLHQSKQYSCDSIENVRNVKYFMGSMRRCADIYVSLWGDILPWVPAPDEIPDYPMYAAMRAQEKKEPTSIALLAGREAFAAGGEGNARARAAPLTFFYFRHPSVLQDIPQHLAGRYTEKPPRRNMCRAERAALLEEIPEALTYDGYGAHFKSIDKHGQIHLCRMQDFEETLQGDLFNSIEAMYDLSANGRRSVADAATTATRPRVVVPVNTHRKLHDAYFRYTLGIWARQTADPAGVVLEHVIPNEIPKRVTQQAEPTPVGPVAQAANIVVVNGPPGCGRTSICAKVVEDIRKIPGSGVPVLAYFPGLGSLTPDACDIKTVILNLYEQSLAIPGVQPYGDEKILRSFTDTIEGIHHFWNHMSWATSRLGRSVVMVIDEASAMTGLDDYANFFIDGDGLSRVPRRVKLVVSLSDAEVPTAERLLKLSPQIRTEVVDVDRLLIKERRALLADMLEPYGESLEPGEAKMIIDKKDSILPLYCKLLCHDILHKGRLLPRARLILQAPGDVVDLVVFMLKRREDLERSAGGALYFSRLVSLLCAARSGLTDLEARELLMKEFVLLDTRTPPPPPTPAARGVSAATSRRSSAPGGARAKTPSPKAAPAPEASAATTPAPVPIEDYLVCGEDTAGYSSDVADAARHSNEIRAIRKRLWGRWPMAPRLLPGSIWSRLLFELRPFVARKVEQADGDGLDTHVLCFSGETVRRGAAEVYFNGRRRRARIHAQLGAFYRGKMFVKHRVLWERGVRECIYHYARAWLWDTLLEVLQPYLIACVVEEGMTYEVARDLGVALREMDACLDAHRTATQDPLEASKKDSLLRSKQSAIRQYHTFLLLFGRGGKETRTTFQAMFQAPLETWRLAQQVRDIHHRYAITYIAPQVVPFYEARDAARVPRAEFSSTTPTVQGYPLLDATCAAGILATNQHIFTWISCAKDAETSGRISPRGEKEGVEQYRRLGCVQMWDLEGRHVRTLVSDETSGHGICAVVASQDEAHLLVASEGWTVQAWDIATGELLGNVPLPVLRGQAANIRGLKYYHEPAARPTATTLPPKAFCAWDTTGRLLLCPDYDERPTAANNTTNAVIDVDFTPGATKMVVAFEDCSSHVFALSGRALSPVSSIVTGEPATQVSFVAQATTHVLTFESRRAILWLADTGVAVQAVDTALVSPVTSVRYDAAAGTIVTVDTQAAVKRFTLRKRGRSRARADEGEEEAGTAEVGAAASLMLAGTESIDVREYWGDETHGVGVWTSNSRYVAGVKDGGVLTFLDLAADAPSLAQCFATDTPLGAQGAVPASPHPALLPFVAMTALPTRPQAFAAVDGTSGVPMVIEITSLDKHCHHLPKSSTMA